MAERTQYQQRAIKNYYDNKEAIMLQRLGEMVTDLYLAEGKKRKQLWERAANALEKLRVPKDQIEHIVATDNPAILANAYQQLLEKK
jgi:hypothetical protein